MEVSLNYSEQKTLRGRQQLAPMFSLVAAACAPSARATPSATLRASLFGASRHGPLASLSRQQAGLGRIAPVKNLRDSAAPFASHTTRTDREGGGVGYAVHMRRRKRSFQREARGEAEPRSGRKRPRAGFLFWLGEPNETREPSEPSKPRGALAISAKHASAC